jgi:hypothetical protein
MFFSALQPVLMPLMQQADWQIAEHGLFEVILTWHFTDLQMACLAHTPSDHLAWQDCHGRGGESSTACLPHSQCA